MEGVHGPEGQGRWISTLGPETMIFDASFFMEISCACD